MGRPGLPVGTWGSISVREVGPKRFRARCRFRDFDGRVRYVVRFGGSKSGAEQALKKSLVERTAAPASGELTRNTKVIELSAMWLAEIRETSRLASSTKARYETIATTFVQDGLGELRLSELTVPAVERFLKVVRTRHGAATAKGVRSVLSSMIAVAVRRGAMTTNPTKDTTPISVSKKIVRALTEDEAHELIEKISADPQAIELDLVDLCIFMLGTGCRIGEACALRLPQVDLDGETVEISATLTAVGLQERTKSDAGWRRIRVPAYVITLLSTRIENPVIATNVALFPSPLGRIRNTSNTTGDLRRIFDRAGYDWVTSHIFRKTVATRLDEAGLSARAIADHLGHAQPSMTQDVYMGRRVASADAARVLGESGH